MPSFDLDGTAHVQKGAYVCRLWVTVQQEMVLDALRVFSSLHHKHFAICYCFAMIIGYHLDHMIGHQSKTSSMALRVCVCVVYAIHQAGLLLLLA